MRPLAVHHTRFFILAFLVLFAPGLSAASVIDYVTEGQPCHDQATCAMSVDGVTVTLGARAGGASQLFWDSEPRDGIGIYNSGSYEADEIENPEWLEITFSKPVLLSAVHLTDLFLQEVSVWAFAASPGYYTECGWYTVNGGPATQFCQGDRDALQSTNATGWFTIHPDAGVPVTSIWMSGLGMAWEGTPAYPVHHDFSLARLEFTGIPEPATLGLLTLALGTVLWRRRAARR